MLHTRVEDAERTGTWYALRAGRILTEVKRRLPYGEFESWVSRHCPCSSRMGRHYRRIWRTWGLDRKRVSELPSLRSAIAWCQQQARRDQPPQPPYPAKGYPVTVVFQTAADQERCRSLVEELGPRGVLDALEVYAGAGALP